MPRSQMRNLFFGRSYAYRVPGRDYERWCIDLERTRTDNDMSGRSRTSRVPHAPVLIEEQYHETKPSVLVEDARCEHRAYRSRH